MMNGGPVMNFPPYGGGQQFYPNNHAMHTLLATQQFQQLQIHSQKQQQQQQLQQHQLHQLQQQQTGDLKMRTTTRSPSPSDRNPPAAKDC